MLNISNNNNAVIKGNSFDNVASLLLLDIWNIDLKEVERGAFESLTSLFYLYHEENAGNLEEEREFVSFTVNARLDLWRGDLPDIKRDAVDSQNSLLQWFLLTAASQNYDFELRTLIRLISVSLLSQSYGNNRTSETDVNSLNKIVRSTITRQGISEITRDGRINLLRLFPVIPFLGASGNDMRVIETDTFFGLDKLSILNLSNSNIKVLEVNAFNGLDNLTNLDLSNNGIRHIERYVFADPIALLELDLSGNNITRIDGPVFERLQSLVRLDLSSNHITEINGELLVGLQSLTFFDLTENAVARIDGRAFNGQDSIIRLYLWNNDISRLENDTFRDLERSRWLYLSNNNISFIEAGAFNGLINVWWLLLSNNSINAIDGSEFQGLDNLFYLDLSYNKLRSIDSHSFEAVSTLTELDLSHNDISEIKPDAFAGLDHLVTLDLSHNRIKSVSGGIFYELISLYALNLSTNAVPLLQSHTFSNQAMLTYLALDNNPITYIEPEAFVNLSKVEYLFLTEVDLRDVDENTVEPLTSLVAISTSDTRLCCLVENRANTTCTSTVPTNPLDTCGSLYPSDVLRVFGWLMGMTALIGNCAVLYLRLYHEQESKVQNRLIASLALADCIMAVYMLIITSADLHFGSDYFLRAPLWRNSGLCRFAGFLAFFSSEASVISLTLITLDRFICITFPLKGWRIGNRACKILLCTTWLSVFVISVPTFIDNSKIPDLYGQSDVCIGLPLHLRSGGTGVLVTTKETEWSRDFTVTFVPLDDTKRPPWLYSIVVFIGVNLLSFIFMVVCYVVMFVKVSRSSKATTNTASRSREIKVARRMAILIGTDFACWMPIILMGILTQTNSLDIPTSLYAWSVIFILPINSSLNPMLYTFMYYFDKAKKSSRSSSS
ncbi:uncharacterized protein [Diadema setosum]|uniref:uncharacterized protein n=1 Tax=Diadema setosum TaxID=31175 RepID=UPI003B3B9D26